MQSLSTNYLHRDLSQEEHKLLCRGLKYVPQPPRINRFQFKRDLESFSRRLRLKEYFYYPYRNNKEECNHDEHRFKNKSTWNPPKSKDPALETYIKAVENYAYRLISSVKRETISQHQNGKLLLNCEPAMTLSSNQQTKGQPLSS